MKSTANYKRVWPLPANVPEGSVVIRDVGPWDTFKSVTNDAEAVVRDLVASGQIKNNGQRLFYFDSDGTLDELIVRNGAYFGFKVGPRP